MLIIIFFKVGLDFILLNLHFFTPLLQVHLCHASWKISDFNQLHVIKNILINCEQFCWSFIKLFICKPICKIHESMRIIPFHLPVCNYWSIPIHAELGSGKMTVGKIYAGLLIVENWRAYKESLANAHIYGNRVSSYQGLHHLIQWTACKKSYFFESISVFISPC